MNTLISNTLTRHYLLVLHALCMCCFLFPTTSITGQVGMMIEGQTSLCRGDITTYSVDHPPNPLVYHEWSVSPSGAATIYPLQSTQGAGVQWPKAAIKWNLAGTHALTVTDHLSATSTITVVVYEITDPYITYNNEVGCQEIYFENDDHATNQIIEKENITVCEYSEVRYTVHGNLIYQFNGSNFDWEVFGGEIIEVDGVVLPQPSTQENGGGLFTGTVSEVVVRWGPEGNGFLKVTETTLYAQPFQGTDPPFVDPFSYCKPRSAELFFDIIEKPTADFLFDDLTAAPDDCYEICKNGIVYFNDLSTGSVEAPIIFWQWDFGDGSAYSHQETPSHQYTTAGNYTVVLTVTNRCGCTHTFSRKICVLEREAVVIECPSVVCEDKIAVYTAINDCHDYHWEVDGGSIIAYVDNTITVRWDHVGPDGFGYVKINGAYCEESCPAWSTIKVPVILQQTEIQGPSVVCANSRYIYKLPPWPATNYGWEVDPPSSLGSTMTWNTLGAREHFVELGTLDPGSFTLKCEYTNYITTSDCKGSSLPLAITVLDQPIIDAPEKICINTALTCTLHSQVPGTPFQLNSASVYTIIKPDGSSHTHTSTALTNPYDIPSSFFDQVGSYKIWVESDGMDYCCSEMITVEVLDKPPAVVDVAGATSTCLNHPYAYSVGFVEGALTHWTINGGHIENATYHIAQDATAIWTSPGAGTKHLIVSREWEEVPGCYSDSYSLQVEDISLTGSIISQSSVFYEDNTYVFTCEINNNVVADLYNWSIDPPNAGSIAADPATNEAIITWYHLPQNTAVMIECEATKCGITETFTYHLTVEKGTGIVQVNTSPNPVCSGEPVTFEVITNHAPPEAFFWNFNDGTPNTSTVTNEYTHIFTNKTTSNINYAVTIQVASSTTSMVTATFVENVTVLPEPNASISPPNAYAYDPNGAPPYVLEVFVPAGNYTYEWYRQPSETDPAILLSGSNYFYNVGPFPFDPQNSEDGLYYCVVTDVNTGCSTTTNKIPILEQGSGGSNGCTPVAPTGISGFSYNMVDCATVVVECTTLEGSPTNIESVSWKVAAPPSYYTIGGGPFTKDQSPEITFHKAGIFRVYITVRYTNQQQGEPACIISNGKYVVIPWVPEFRHSITCNGSNQYELNLFDYSSIHPDFSGPTSTLSHQWIVTDGTNTTTTTGLTFTSIPVNPGGLYDVTLIVGDGNLPYCTTTAEIKIPDLPVADFEAFTTYPGTQPFAAPPYMSCENREIEFNNLSYNMNEIISYVWDFGNYTKSHMENPTMSYPTGGNPAQYFVELIVTDKYGCVVTADKLIEVYENTLDPENPQYHQNNNPPPFFVCPGLSVNPPIEPQYDYDIIIAPQPHTYQWYNEGAPLPNWTTEEFDYTVNSSGGYWVQIKDQHHCILNLNPTPAAIAVKKAPTAFIKGKQDMCQNVPERFTALTGMPASANLSYSWNAYTVYPGNPSYSYTSTNKYWDLTVSFFGDIIITLQVEDLGVGGCISPVQYFPVKVWEKPADPVLDVTPLDCDRYELELSCTNPGAYSADALFNWSTGASGSSTTVYQGGVYRLWVTEENGCRSHKDIDIPYPPNFYFWRFPTGCYEFCPEHLPRYVYPMAWTYGQTNPGFEDWAWKIDGNFVQNNGGFCSSCLFGACFCGYKDHNNIGCQLPCRLEIGLPPDNEGQGDYTWMLENELCEQESDIMQIRINDCCELDLRVIEIACLQATGNYNTYQFQLDVLNVPCDAWYNLYIKDNNGNPITPTMSSSNLLHTGTNHLHGVFDALNTTSTIEVNFYIEVLCQPNCYGQALNVSLPACSKKRKAPEDAEHQKDETSTFASLVVVPNPAHTLVTFHYRLPEHEENQPLNGTLFVTDATGRPVKQFKISEPSGSITTDITTFTPGLYFVTLAENNRPDVTKKLLVIRN